MSSHIQEATISLPALKLWPHFSIGFKPGVLNWG